MHRHDFLTGLHERLAPRSYLEIGVNDGRGLARSKTRTIGVDPAFRIVVDLACDLQLVKATSDDFFARDDAIAWFPEGVVDLSFIDGMHLFEFAFRDFINTEKLSAPTSVAVFDDMLPRSVEEAARDRFTREWTGDVFKVALVLERYRQDLVVLPVDTKPTGVVVVVGLDPSNGVLKDAYDEILGAFLTEDPQTVPDTVMLRQSAADPQLLLDSPVWQALVQARDSGGPVPDLEPLRALRGTASYVHQPPANEPWPPKKPAAKKAAPKPPPPPPTLARRIRRAIKNRL